MRDKTELEVNLNFLSDNFNELKTSWLQGQEVIFMVKANAYGHGLIPITCFALKELGIKDFGVATREEAKLIVNQLSEYEPRVLIFSDHGILDPTTHCDFENYPFIPVLSSFEQLEVFLKSIAFKFCPIYLKFNTGMNRLGIDVTEVEKVVKILKKYNRLELEHVMSHFSSSYLPKSKAALNANQLSNFDDVIKQLNTSGIKINQTSFANSGAIETGIGLNYSHVRPGLMLYGPRSVNSLECIDKNKIWNGKIISNLSAQILSKRAVKKSEIVGYGASTVPYDGVLVCLAIGYGDGWSTHMKGLDYHYCGKNGRSLGRVNMDMTTVFFIDSKVEDFVVGERIILWDETQDRINYLSEQSNQIPYEIFCQINDRIVRKYHVK